MAPTLHISPAPFHPSPSRPTEVQGCHTKRSRRRTAANGPYGQSSPQRQSGVDLNGGSRPAAATRDRRGGTLPSGASERWVAPERWSRPATRTAGSVSRVKRVRNAALFQCRIRGTLPNQIGSGCGAGPRSRLSNAIRVDLLRWAPHHRLRQATPPLDGFFVRRLPSLGHRGESALLAVGLEAKPPVSELRGDVGAG